MEAIHQKMVALSLLSNALIIQQFQTKMENALQLQESALTAVSQLQMAVQQLALMVLNLELQDVLLLYNLAKMDLHQPQTDVLKNAQED